ncbi:MAG: glycosyltransferase [Chloroflexi bacterium]|nr:glycosyltransferase [Chloroflexota bacterium]
MKVLHVYKNYYPTFGGIESHIRLLCAGLRDVSDVDVEVLVAGADRRTSTEVVDGVRVTRAGALFTFASAPVSPALFREMARRPVDIVHLHFPYPIGELAYLLMGRSRRLVITYHSDIVRQKRLLQLYRPFLRRLLARADRICVTNPRYAATSPFLSPFLDKCTVVPLGIEPARFAGNGRTRALAAAIRRDVGSPIVLFVGKLRYYKGIEYLVEAMQAIPAHLVVVGEGPYASVIRAQVKRLGLDDRVHLVDEVADEALPAYYQAADVFVLPSTHRSEAFGAVQLEAMAVGVPVVCTELGTGTTYVNRDGETGLVVPPRDAAALAGAVNRLLADDELRGRLGRQARHRVEAEFSAERMVDLVVTVYRQVLGS